MLETRCSLDKCWRIIDVKKILASTSNAIVSFIRHSQAFVTFATAFVSIHNIRKGIRHIDCE